MWNLNEEQKAKYKKTIEEWLGQDLTIEDLKRFQKRYKELKKTVQKLDKKYSELSKEDRIRNIYKSLSHILMLNQVQPLNEVIAFEFWDIDYGCIETSIIFENNEFKLSEFFIGFAEEVFEPFEDIHIDVLNEFLEQKEV